MNKQHILDEIRRTAKANGGEALGRQRFEKETGTKRHDWYGRYWARWEDAVKEAGLTSSGWQEAFDDEVLLARLASFMRELGRFPSDGDLRVKKHGDPSFPNHDAFRSHFGTRQKLRRALIQYCQTHSGFDDVVSMCGPVSTEDSTEDDAPKKEKKPAQVVLGFVYLMKSGKHYKIGKTNAAGRREYELRIQLPESLSTVHVIKTDDPDGIEAYWHRRFASKRANGEWFQLTLEDVQAFKRRTFM